MAKREILWDVMRGIAIMLVVIGHSGVSSFAWSFIYSFHMPLFFFISGYFLKANLEIKQFCIKKLKDLYVPFFKYYAILILASPLLHRYLLTKNNYGTVADVSSALFLAARFRVGAIDLLGQFWFLPVLFFVGIIAFVGVRITEKYFHSNYVCLISGGAIFSILGGVGMRNHWYAPYDMYGVLYFLFYYIAGWYCHHVNPIRIGKANRYILPCVVLLTLYCFYKENIEDWVVLKILAACIGIVLVFVVSKCLEKVTFLSKTLQYIGSHTMSIYVWHVFLFKLLELSMSYWVKGRSMTEGWNGCYASQAWYWVCCYSLVGVLVPILLVKLLNVIRKK